MGSERIFSLVKCPIDSQFYLIVRSDSVVYLFRFDSIDMRSRFHEFGRRLK